MYIWSIKTSYSYMQGLRDWKFWLRLPFKAHQITINTLYCETCGKKNPCQPQQKLIN